MDFSIPLLNICVLTILLSIKHALKDPRYINDTYNYAFAAQTAWKPHATTPQMLFDAACHSNVASAPPFYPTLYKYIVMRIPMMTPLRMQSFFDWLAQVVLYFILADVLSPIAAWVGILIFNATPMVFRETLYFTDRLWATALLWINLWSLYSYSLAGPQWMLAIAIISFAALINSHKHSLQLLVILYVVLSVVQITPAYLGVVFAGELFAIVTTLGYSWHVHWAHARLLAYCYRFLFPKDGGGYGKDQLIFIRKARGQPAATAAKRKSLRSLAWILISNWEFTFFGTVGIILAVDGFRVANHYWTLVMFAILATAVLTQFIRRLKFLGEGVRYLEYAALPAVAATWPWILSREFELQIAIGAAAGLWLALAAFLDGRLLLQLKQNAAVTTDNDFKELLAHVKNSDWDRFIVFPIDKTYAFAWYTGKHILHFLGAGGFWQAKDWFPQVRRPIPSFYEEYDMRYILLDERYVKADEIDLGPVIEVYRRSTYVVFRIGRDSKDRAAA